MSDFLKFTFKTLFYNVESVATFGNEVIDVALFIPEFMIQDQQHVLVIKVVNCTSHHQPPASLLCVIFTHVV